MSEPMGPITIYLLHFDQKIGHVQHYLGSTTTGRLEQRMVEHSKGRGSALTAEAVKRGIGWTITQAYTTTDRGEERRRKQIRKYARKCWLCQHPGEDHDLFTVVPRPVPVAMDGTTMLSWDR